MSDNLVHSHFTRRGQRRGSSRRFQDANGMMGKCGISSGTLYLHALPV